MTNPRLVNALVGVLLIVVGALLALRPFSATSWVGLLVGLGFAAGAIAAALHARRTGRLLDYLGAAALLLTAIVLLAWRGLSIFAIAVIAGVGLIVWGLALIMRGIGHHDSVGRVSDVLFGIAAIAVAIAALGWPGVTIFAAIFVVGIALIWIGLTRLYSAIRGRTQTGDDEPSGTHRWIRLAAAVIAALIAVPLAVVSIGMHRPVGEQPGPFYSADLPAGTAPGTLLKTEPFSRNLPAGSQAWKILYATTGRGGAVVPASGLVLAPKELPEGPRPLIAWAHGTTGIARDCAPSLLPDALAAGAAPAVTQVVTMGAVMVATDYVGMGTEGPDPYLVGEGQAHSVLDSIRAVRQFNELALQPETVVWGHSQGGAAALWTGILAPSYAPDAGVTAVAAMAPAANLTAMANSLQSLSIGSMLAAYVLQAYTDYYDDVRFNDYVSVAGRLPVRAMASRCIPDPSTTVSVAEALIIGSQLYLKDPTTGPLGRRLVENTPSAPLTMPVFLGQGEADPLVKPDGQREYVAQQCAVGTNLEFREYPGRDHLSLVAEDSPAIADLMAWTKARLDGVPAVGNCPRT